MSLLSHEPYSDLIESISALIEQARGEVRYFNFSNHHALRSELSWMRELERERANVVAQLNNKGVDDE